MKPKSIFYVLIVVFLAVILVQNTPGVTIKLLFWQVSMSRILLVVISLLIGFAFGYLYAKKMIKL